jgi:hypothetical protein
MAEGVGKTPVSELQEKLIKCGITPKYELDQQQGPDHKPTFWYRVTAADVTGMYEAESGWLYCSIF